MSPTMLDPGSLVACLKTPIMPARWLVALLVVAACLCAAPLSAADRYYDVDPATAPIDGGTANWSDANWKAAAGGTTGVAWAANDTAIFDAIVGSPSTTTITLGGVETATAVTFNAAGYTLTGGTLALAGAGGGNWITMNADGAIESALSVMRFKGSAEATISGGGALGGNRIVLDGVGYYNWRNPTMFGWTQSLFLSTVPQTANFSGGNVDGQVMLLTVAVPEPSAFVLMAAGGFVCAAWGAWRRQVRRNQATVAATMAR